MAPVVGSGSTPAWMALVPNFIAAKVTLVTRTVCPTQNQSVNRYLISEARHSPEINRSRYRGCPAISPADYFYIGADVLRRCPRVLCSGTNCLAVGGSHRCIRHPVGRSDAPHNFGPPFRVFLGLEVHSTLVYHKPRRHFTY